MTPALCKYCNKEVTFGPGAMLIESYDDTEGLAGFTVHEECYQQSGEDEGYVERFHRTLDEEL